MLSKNKIKLITSLKQKKYRQQQGLFVVEGVKTIKEFLQSNIQLDGLYTIETFNNDANSISSCHEILITEAELKRISFLKTPNKALAVFKMPIKKPIEQAGIIVALDHVRDPGNLGTIIRLCDWFGIKNLVCSHTTADCFNPKTIQATMGSLTRVQINYVDLVDFLSETKMPIYGAFMEGENVYKCNLKQAGVLVMGNEANGISKQVETFITHKIAIPRFGNLQAAESLNVAMATSILLSEFKRSR